MNKSLLTIAGLVLTASSALAQLPEPPPPGGSRNPYLIQGVVTPVPLLPAEFNGTGTIALDVGNTGSDPIQWVTGQQMLVTVSLSFGVPDVGDPNDALAAVNAISGPGSAWFSWQYFPLQRTFRGTQIADIPANSRQTINIAYRVAENSFREQSYQNGFNANISPPAYTNPQPTDDDTVAFYTFVEAFDYGDAPSSYGGVRHEINFRKDGGAYLGYMSLGANVDPENEYQGSPDATGDDLNQTGGLDVNDENGVVFPPMIAGTTVNIPVTVTLWDWNPEAPSAAATLRAWVDWDKLGTFSSTGIERIVNFDVNAWLETEGIPAWTGSRSFVFVFPVAIPADATGSYLTRFRFGPSATPTTASASHGEVEDHMFTITSPPGGSISGTVGADTNGDGTPDTFEAGVVLTLRDQNGNPVMDGTTPVTTTTNSSGFYTFENVPPGSYQVLKTPSGTYVSLSDIDGGDPNLIGDGTNPPIVVLSGQNNSGNNFLEFLQKCPDQWTAWQDKWDTDLGGETDPADNPDGDRYSNLLEYAFCMPPHSGIRKPFCLFSSVAVDGGVDGVYSRTAGGAKDVIYQLELAPTLGLPTVWTPLVLDGSNTTVTNNGDGTETVRISDLESLFPLGTTRGFVRIRIILDDGTTQATDHTETLGWTKSLMNTCCSTYNNPFLQCSLFTGTVDSVDGQELVVATSTGPFDLATAITGAAGCYIEVTSGENTGRRYDVVSLGSNRITLANDSSLYDASPPFNTQEGALPADLAGDTIILRRHHTLDYLFSPDALGATGSQSTADQVQVFAGGAWTIYWLFDDAGSARWVTAANAGMADMGGNVIPPGQGMFFNNRHDPVILLAFGEVRENPFIRPMRAGNNLVGGGYPIDQSLNGPGGRAMNPSTGFFGSTDFKTADSAFIWKADADSAALGYHTYYLANGAPSFPSLLRWVIVGDKNLVARDSETLLPGNRSAFIRTRDPIPVYTCPAPWNP